MNYLSFIASASALGLWLLRGQRFDVIFVFGSSPILQAIAGIVIKLFTRAALVTWVQDLWPQSLEATGFIKHRGLLKMVSRIVRWIYQHNDALLVQSEGFLRPVQAMAGSTPVDYHPNPGEVAFSRPLAPGPPGLVLEAGFNIVFAGNLGTVQALDTVLAAADLLRSHADIRFVLIGSGSRAESTQKEIVNRGLDNVRLPGRFPPQDMPGILAQASTLLVSLSRNSILSKTVPSKVQAYLAAGRPIIASLDGEGARVVEMSGAGVVCAAEDAMALAQAVLKLRSTSSEDLQRMGHAGRNYYLRHFEPGMLTRRLMKRFQDILADRRRGSGRVTPLRTP